MSVYISSAESLGVIRQGQLFPDTGRRSAVRFPSPEIRLQYGDGADLKLAFTDILSGSVGLKLKLKFLFFSKTWRKEIASWTGLCPLKKSDGRQEWCDVPLLEIGGRLSMDLPGEGLNMNWATAKMPAPFVLLNPIKESGTVPADMTTVGELDQLQERVMFGYVAQCVDPIGID
jgi:hypothetical protein